MPARLVIVSPSSPGSGLIEEVRKAAATDAELLVFGHYPSRRELREISGDSGKPLAYLIDCTEESHAFRVLWDLSRVQPGATTVILNGPRRLSTLIRARQRGVAAYLSDFHNPTDLGRLTSYLNAQRGTSQARNQPGKVVSFLPAQGGSGASTIALHVAASVGQRLQSDCLLVDFDLHTGTIGFQLGLQPEYSLASIMSEEEITEETVRAAVVRTEGADVMIGATEPVHPKGRSCGQTREFIALVKQMYSHTFFDLPPAALSAPGEVLQQSNLIYLVCTPEITSLHLAMRKLAYLEHFGVTEDKVRLLVNRASSWGGLDIGRMEQVVGRPVDWLIDNDYRAVRQSALAGGVVSPDSALSQQFSHLGSDILEELEFSPEPAHAEPEERVQLAASAMV